MYKHFRSCWCACCSFWNKVLVTYLKLSDWLPDLCITFICMTAILHVRTPGFMTSVVSESSCLSSYIHVYAIASQQHDIQSCSNKSVSIVSKTNSLCCLEIHVLPANTFTVYIYGSYILQFKLLSYTLNCNKNARKDH